jgi:hypothetical protein
MTPSCAAIRCKPDFSMTLDQLQVSPDKYQMTGTLPLAACGGVYTANCIGQLHTLLWCSITARVPPKLFQLETVFMRLL